MHCLGFDGCYPSCDTNPESSTYIHCVYRVQWMRHSDSVHVVFERSRKATGGRKRANERASNTRNGILLEICRLIGIKRHKSSKWNCRSLTHFTQEIHVGCLYRIHQRHAITSTLEDEPRNADITKLLNFRVNAVHARTSILGFVDILRAQGEGYRREGEESIDLGIQDHETENHPQGAHVASDSNEDATNAVPQFKQSHPFMPSLSIPVPSQSVSQVAGLGSGSLSQQTSEHAIHAIHNHTAHELRPHTERSHTEPANDSIPLNTGHFDHEQQRFDVAHPFFDPAMLELLPGGELPDLSQYEPLPMSLYDVEIGDWTMTSVESSIRRSAF
jgi:hypothetical protein